jgi:glycosyltransferase involved in cell wall biosynthesis
MKSYLFVFIVFLCTLHSAQSICIVAGETGLGPWDPSHTKTGITGSEEAIIYVSKELALLGYRVVVFANVPKDSIHSLPEANPRFVDFDFLPQTRFDIGISWRMPEIAECIKGFADKVYFWPHDLSNTIVTEDEISGFEDVLWLSQSQRMQWISVNPSFARFTHIFGNGIVAEDFPEVQERKNPYSCIYASCYKRGLQILLNFWPTVKKEFPEATLDIYHGWRDKDYTPLLTQVFMTNQLKHLAFLGVTEHGMVGHEELNKAYNNTSFWTYPCTCLPVETFCISALRAQFSGTVPVIIQGSALKETVRHGYQCDSVDDYLSTLLYAMKEAHTISLEERKKQRDFISNEYTWKIIAKKWKTLFDRTQ